MIRRDFLEYFAMTLSGGIGGITLGGGFGYIYGKSEGRSKGIQTGIDRGIHRAGGIDPGTNDEQIEDINRGITLYPGEYEAVQFDFAKKTLLMYSMIAKDYLDAFIFTEENYRAYEKDDDDVQYLLLHSRLDTTKAIVKAVLPEGRYVIVFDNTTKGRASPSSSVDVGYAIEAYQREED